MNKPFTYDEYMREKLKWRSIATAPKDGQWIMLGYYPDYMNGKCQGGHPVIAWWSNRKQSWCDGHRDLRASGVFSPTHWMPLPYPPANNKEA